LSGEFLNIGLSREKIAREAATLLYSGIEKEYKQAKLKAAKTFRSKFLPTNLEVAIELDKIAEENEGSTRQERLVQMRKEALRLMKLLEAYNPLLIGSVWRGTICHKSDIDIIVHHDEPDDIIRILAQNDFKTVQSEWMTVTKKGKEKASFHIYSESPSKEKIEIIVRCSEEFSRNEKCEIYGDTIKGLKLHELEKLFTKDATKRFLPL